MNASQKKAFRMAMRIDESRTDSPGRSLDAELPRSAWAECEKLVRRIEKAAHHNWDLAADRLRRDLPSAVRNLRYRLDALLHELGGRRELRPSVRSIYDDLICLENEFAKATIDSQGRHVSVTTETIELDGVHLGPFCIKLACDRLDELAPFTVTAVDPHPAMSDEHAFHPHVQGTELCLGEAREPIRQSLSQVRLFDFFCIIRQILRTYNPESAYVSLERWFGIECQDCSTVVDDEEMSTCERCQGNLCRDCSFYCRSCDSGLCAGCQVPCPICDDSFCPECLPRCARCGEQVCQECLSHEICTNCQEPEDDVRRAEEGADAPVCAHGVGQAGLSA